MLNINRAEVIGNLTRDPEMRVIPSGQPVCNFGVATNRRYQNKSGEWENAQAEFHNIVVWGKLAEACQKVLKKGDRVYLTGRLQTRQWEGQDGQKRQRTEIVADTIVGPDQTKNAMGFSSDGDVGGAAEPVSESVEEIHDDSKTKAQAEASDKKSKKPAGDDEIDLDNIPF